MHDDIAFAPMAQSYPPHDGQSLGGAISANLLDVLLANTPDVISRFDRTLRCLYVSPSVEKITGIAAPAFIGKTFTELNFPPENIVAWEQTLEATFRSGQNQTLAFSFETPNGLRHYEATVLPELMVDRVDSAIAISRDVTDLKEAKLRIQRRDATIREQFAELQAIYHSAPIGIAFHDTNLRYIHVNEKIAEINGIPVEQHIGRTLWEVLPTMADQLAPIFQQVLQTGEPLLNVEVRIATPAQPGIERDWLTNYVPVKDEAGTLIGVTAIVQEITAYKQAEVALLQSQERFELAVRGSNEGIWDWNILTNEDYFSDRWCELLGYTQAELQPRYEVWLELVHPDDRDRVLAHIASHLQNETPYNIEYRMKAKSGEYRWYQAKGEALRNEQGQPVRMSGSLADISDRKQIEEELRQKNAILSVINESTPTPLFMKDREGRIIFANPATLQVLGKPASEVIGYRDAEVYPEFGASISETDRRIMETGVTEVVEESPDGIRTFLGVKVPYRNEAGEVIGLIGVANDITDRIRNERDRERILHLEKSAREEAERTNRIKDEFLAILSHELRTPMNPILGWTRLLRTGKLSPERAQDALTTIERNATLQVQLIDDLLDVSRILRGKLTLNVLPVDLMTPISAAIDTMQLAANAKSIQIHTTLMPNVDSVMGDAGRIQQIVWNLLSNAVKFTPAGGHVYVRLEEQDGYAQLQVRDTGKGISPEFLPYLFESFRQEDSTTTRQFGGLGLGLAIARQLIELHGGTIQASSPGENQGSTFTVRFPIGIGRSVQLAAAPDVTDLDLSGVRILVVDDEPDSRDLVAFILEASGAIVTVAESGLEALQQFDQTVPDLLITDIGMPDMNGYELLQQVRRMQPVPAIALTAYAGETDRQQALSVGFQQHMAKPIDTDELVAIAASLTLKQFARK